MPIPQIIANAFKISDEAALIKLCRDKKIKADTYFHREGGIKMRREKVHDDYSVFKIDNKTYLMAPKESYLGKGAFGQVKLAICIDSDPPDFGQLYAIKRETTNTEQQQRESEIAQDLGLMVAKKVERPSETKKLNNQKKPITEKYYSVMNYLGTELYPLLLNDFLSKTEKTEIALQTTLQLDLLHQQYVHRDIKPENILVDLTSTPLVVHLIDYGLSQKNELFNDQTRRCGTPGFMPGSIPKDNHMEINADLYIRHMLLLKDLKNADVFALKKTIYNPYDPPLIDIVHLEDKHFVLRDMLDTTNEEAACKREDTTEKLAAAIICYQLDIGLVQPLTNEQSRQVIDLYKQHKTQKEIQDKIHTFYPKEITQAFNICCQLNIFNHEKYNLSRKLSIFIVNVYQHQDSDPLFKERMQLLIIFEQNGEPLSEVLTLDEVSIDRLMHIYHNGQDIHQELFRIKVDKITAEHRLSFDRDQINTQRGSAIVHIQESSHQNEEVTQAEMISAYLDIATPLDNSDWVSSHASTIVDLYQRTMLENSLSNSSTTSKELWENQKNKITAYMVLSTYSDNYTPPENISENDAYELSACYSKYQEAQLSYSDAKLTDFKQCIKLQIYCLTFLNEVLEAKLISKMTPQRINRLITYCEQLEQKPELSLAEKKQRLSTQIETEREALEIIDKAYDIATQLNLSFDLNALTEKNSTAIVTHYQKQDPNKAPEIAEFILLYLNIDGEFERKWIKSEDASLFVGWSFSHSDNNLTYQESRQSICAYMLGDLYANELNIDVNNLYLSLDVNAYLTNLYDNYKQTIEQHPASTPEATLEELKIRVQASLICINEFEDNMETLAQVSQWSLTQCQALIDGYKEKTTQREKHAFTEYMILKTTLQTTIQTYNSVHFSNTPREHHSLFSKAPINEKSEHALLLHELHAITDLTELQQKIFDYLSHITPKPPQQDSFPVYLLQSVLQTQTAEPLAQENVAAKFDDCLKYLGDTWRITPPQSHKP